MDYEKIYQNLIDRAKARETPSGYIENHHIIPKCIGGNDNDSNLVLLTLREHFLAHLLLHKMYPGNKSILTAYWFMSNRGNFQSGRLYESAKEKFVKSLLGSTLSSETKKKISQSHVGLKATDETKRKMSLSKIGHRLSKETRELISVRQKGRKRNPTSEEVKEKIRKTVQVFEYYTPYGVYSSLREAARDIPLGLTSEGIRHRINSKSENFSDWHKINIRK